MPQISIETAVQHHRAGRLAEAEAIYRQILSVQPRHPDALHLLGLIAGQTGHVDAALDLINQAIAANPRTAEFHVSLGEQLGRVGRLQEEIAAYERATQLNPNLPTIPAKLAVALIRLGRREEATAQARRAVQLQPNSADAHNNLGGLLLTSIGESDEVIEEFRTAIRLNPTWPAAHRNLGIALAGRAAVADGLGELREAMRLAPEEAQFHSELLLWLQYDPQLDNAAILAEHRKWAAHWADPLANGILPHANDRSPTRRLRIGYVSPDLRTHPISAFLLPVLQHHDRNNFEIFCYSNLLQPDEVTLKLKQAVDAWRDTGTLSDIQFAEQIRLDRIDILVDLALHSYGHRLLVFARKPAPVQVTWLGYPGTTGLATMDYRLTDPYLDPPGAQEPYAERSVRLPRCYWGYPPHSAAPSVSPLPAARNGFVTFGCFNNFAKASPDAQNLWVQVLAAIPKSRLLTSAPPGSHRDAFRQLFKDHGIAGNRIEFFNRGGLEEYFRLYHRVDILLDPTPFGGGTTTLDALWMGVPIITLAGNRAVGRGGVSILTNLGLPELIAKTPEEYVAIASKLAGDPPRLSALRTGLREKMQQSPLMDTKRFTADLEAAFRKIWIGWCKEAHVQPSS